MTELVEEGGGEGKGLGDGRGRACRSAVRKEAAAVNLFRVSQEGLARPAACLRGPGGFAPRRLPPYVSPRQPSGFPSLPPQLPLPALTLPPPASLSSKLPSTVYHFHCRVFLSLYCPSLSGSRRFLPQAPRTATLFYSLAYSFSSTFLSCSLDDISSPSLCLPPLLPLFFLIFRPHSLHSLPFFPQNTRG